MLRKTSRQLRLLTRALDVLEEPVLLFDALGRVIYANDAVTVWPGEDNGSVSLRAEIAELARVHPETICS